MLEERCLKAQPKKKQSWYLDSGCSRHMIGDESLFQELDRKKSGNVSFVTTPKVSSEELALLVTILILKSKMCFLLKI